MDLILGLIISLWFLLIVSSVADVIEGAIQSYYMKKIAVGKFYQDAFGAKWEVVHVGDGRVIYTNNHIYSVASMDVVAFYRTFKECDT